MFRHRSLDQSGCQCIDANSLGGTERWNAIPGARGCTPQSCAYRDHYQELRGLGAAVYGLSTQPTDYQREAVSRLQLPFALLSDAAGEFSTSLRLPWFEVEGVRLLKRLTLIVGQGRILHCVYPVFPPDTDVGQQSAGFAPMPPNQTLQRTGAASSVLVN